MPQQIPSRPGLDPRFREHMNQGVMMTTVTFDTLKYAEPRRLELTDGEP